MPYPTESSILTSFLLPPAPLPTILPLPKFTALFPPSARPHPQIPLLYRDLQHQRALVIDTVRRDIAAEVKRGEGQKREVARQRRREERDVGVGMEGMEGEGKWEGRLEELVSAFAECRVEYSVYDADYVEKAQNTTGTGTATKAHTLTSILPEMENACEDMEAEIAELQEEAERIMQEMQGIVGGLSDLRYGKFAQPVGGGEVREEVLEGLKGLREVCGRAGAGNER